MENETFQNLMMNALLHAEVNLKETYYDFH
jgi:hypothetical protein